MNRRLEITRVESADTYGQLNQNDLFAVEAKTYCLDPTINLTTFELLHSYLCFFELSQYFGLLKLIIRGF